MALKDALNRLSGTADESPRKAAATTSDKAEPRRTEPRTAPGTMMGFLSKQTADSARVRELEERLNQFEGSLPVRRLDAKRIRHSRFANRHEDHYRTAAYQQLVADISAAGRNVQPIRVRPVADEAEHDFELVYGHRRLRACQQLGIPVEAVIGTDDDAALFEAMCRENSSRADLSAYEEGLSYKRALELKIYPSQAKLAVAVGVTQAHVSQVLGVANLPAEIIAAFPSPLEIQYRWAEAIERGLKEDRAGLMGRAQEIDHQRFSSAKQVFDYLIGRPRDVSVDVVVGGKRRAVIRSSRGVVSVAFSKHAVEAARMKDLQAALERFLADPSGGL